jgi:hypothetical protein
MHSLLHFLIVILHRQGIRSPLKKQLQEGHKENRFARALAENDMSLTGLREHNPRHRELFNLFSSFEDFYCSGGFLGIIAKILALIGIGVIKNGGGGGGSKNSKNNRERGLRDDLKLIQNKANYENMSDQELRDLVDRLLRGLEFNVPGNDGLHGRNLFLQLLGIVNCKPQTPSTPQNSPPTAVNDNVTINPDETVTIRVLDNDNDPNGDPLNVVSKTDPASGTATISSDGQTITYKPLSPSFCGTDTFNYSISDGNNDPVTAVVTVTVNCPTIVVDAVDDIKNILKDTATNIDVLDNDTTSGEPLSVKEISTQPTFGFVEIVGNEVKYTPNPGFCGTDTFGYTASSGGVDDNALVTVIVQCVTAVDDTASIDRGIPTGAIDVLDNDFSTPLGNPLTVVGFTKNPTNGFVKINEDGTVTYTPKPAFCDCVPQDTFDYKVVSDVDGLSDIGTVTITIDCDVQAPELR